MNKLKYLEDCLYTCSTASEKLLKVLEELKKDACVQHYMSRLEAECLKVGCQKKKCILKQYLVFCKEIKETEDKLHHFELRLAQQLRKNSQEDTLSCGDCGKDTPADELLALGGICSECQNKEELAEIEPLKVQIEKTCLSIEGSLIKMNDKNSEIKMLLTYQEINKIIKKLEQVKKILL